MARRYDVEGTKSFLIAAVVLLLLSLWFIRDGWFPTEAILERHPPGKDSFYLFNKTTGVLLLLGAVICGYIHTVVK